jgi:hypothetical protein
MERSKWIYSFSRIVMPEDKAFFTSNNSCDRTLENIADGCVA